MASSRSPKPRASRLWGQSIALVLLLTGSGLSAGDSPAQTAHDLTDASLEALLNMEVSSPGRKEQKLNQTAAAIYVITQEDIRRSGAASVPEVLRMVPGLQVARINASSWAISARGFNGRFADKMLVMIDGRSIYNHLYSGVYWEQNEVALDDIERIEVVRGPVATMWGSNAVNGVINIITRPARETQGLQVGAGGGNAEHGFGSIRYGGSVGGRAFYRVDTEYFDRGPLAGAAGQAGHDQWDSGRVGGRLDWQVSQRDQLTVEVDASRGGGQQTVFPNYPLTSLSAPVPDDVTFSDEHVLGRWTHTFSARSDMAWQFSVSDEERSEGFGRMTAWTGDADFQHHVALSPRHDLMWGLGLRLYRNHMMSQSVFPAPSAVVRFDPAASHDMLASLFAQDQIALRPESLSLTLGVRIEHNAFTGFETQPSARLLWSLTPRQHLWTAISRAVRTPALTDRDLVIDFQIADPGVVGVLRGNPNFQSETALAYEAGYRNQPARWLTLDLAAFFCNYGNLRTFEIGAPFLQSEPQPVVVVPLQFANQAGAHTYGMELATNWSLTPRWRLSGNYSWFRYGLTRGLAAKSTSVDPEGVSPTHQAQFRTQWDLSRRLTFDTGIYFVSALTGIAVPGYVRTDARLGWRLSSAAEISVEGQNLLNGRHLEFRPNDYLESTQPGRAAFLKVTWAF